MRRRQAHRPLAVAPYATLVRRIEDAYEQLDHEVGWRFLCSPKSTLAPTTRLVFVGLNPGGGHYEPPAPSLEAGNAYRVETGAKTAGPTSCKPRSVACTKASLNGSSTRRQRS